MTESFNITRNYFDQNNENLFTSDIATEAQEIAGIVLDLSQVTIDMASIHRVPRYYVHKRENNAEHSFMLGLVAMEVTDRYFPGLDTGLATQFSLVHDLVELETNDIPTFDADKATLVAKHSAEQAALRKLQDTLPSHIADMLTWYEEQEQPEARLVRHLDKQLPYAVNINGAGTEVMHEDYDVTSLKQLAEKNDLLEKRFDEMFPDPSHVVLRKTHGLLARRFALEFKEAV